MSFEALVWAKNQVTGSTGRKAVLMALAERAGFQWECWPSQATIAQEVELGDRQVRRILSELEEGGFITREHRGRHGSGGGRTSDMIRLTGHIDRKVEDELPDTGDRVTGHPRPTYRTPMSGEPPENHQEPSLTLIPVGGVTEAASTSALQDAFELFWTTYRRTGSKKVARDCWFRAVKKDAPAVILAGLERWMAYWDSPEATKIKWPQGWLNEERWRDDPPPIRVTGTKAATMDAIRRWVNEDRPKAVEQ